jgi:hypothetical protein
MIIITKILVIIIIDKFCLYHGYLSLISVGYIMGIIIDKCRLYHGYLSLISVGYIRVKV